jgi:hypothetical protein
VDKESIEKITQAIAKQLPDEVLYEVVAKAIGAALSSLHWVSHDIDTLVRNAVLARAKEILETDFKEAIEKQARELALQAAGNLLAARRDSR